MKKINQFDGISSTLLKNNYSTTYFTTHDSQFDNIEGFLRANDFQNIISQSDYPNSEIKTTLGVPDDYMFRYSIPILNKLHKNEKPFFATFMTSSDHGPYYIPEYFTPNTNDIKKQITEYADWSLNRFIKMSSKEQWFDNTIFVFVADHGAPLDAKYDISLNYFHTPLIFFAPKIFQHNKTYKNIGSQIDIYPTIMGMLKIPYINNTLGVDLINKKRKYAIINDDDKIGILDTSYFCILKKHEAKLFKYRKDDKVDYSTQNKEIVEMMTEYGKANMQVFQMMLLNKQTTLNNRTKALKSK
jgi:phosphoglycerol transferase MdoB-like AlkP superfamily enzyme